MKERIGIVFTIVVFAVYIYFYKPIVRENNLKVIDEENISAEIVHRGFIGAVDFVYDDEENLYIAYKDRIQFVNNKGYSKTVFKDKNLEIASLEYSKDKLYFSSACSIYEYDINEKIQKEIIKNLPNKGDYKESIIEWKNNYLYISIGSATNSGVVGDDNKWNKEQVKNCDVSPKDIKLKGTNFQGHSTGAFVPYKNKNIKGAIIKGNTPGNSSILIYNLNTKAMETYAWGIRNIKGMDFNSEEKLIVSVGGMEDRGLRPIKNDVDYLYDIKKNEWYGFPDYTGGDPVNSPRFQKEDSQIQNFILEEHPNYNPPAPIYQHESLNSISKLVVDKNGVLGETDSIYFYDEKENKILKYTKNNILIDIIEFSEVKVSNIKIFKEFVYILDKKLGIIYRLSRK
ncbi:MAG: hypothetical protein RSB70_02580 [Clostridium sp.]